MFARLANDHDLKEKRLPMTQNRNHSDLWAVLSPAQLEVWIAQAQVDADQGQLPDYIPQLSTGDRRCVAVCIQRLTGEMYAVGQTQTSFTLMSVIKPMLLLYLLETVGTGTVFQRVGQQPSDDAYNSLSQLERDRGWPRNPMLNSGAIALAGMIPNGTSQQRCEHFLNWLNQKSGAHLFLDRQMLASVQSRPNQTNGEIAKRLATAGYLSRPDLALETYNAICCLAGTVQDLARLGLLLAAEHPSIAAAHRLVVNQMMLTCGLYQQSADFAERVGWPTKSGVSGAVLTVVPSQLAIALYGPALDATGNSIASLSLLQKIAQVFQDESPARASLNGGEGLNNP